MANGKPSSPPVSNLRKDGLARRILDALVKQGWRIEGGRKHVRFIPPDKTQAIVTHSTTPGGHAHVMKNWIAQLRRSGFVWEG